VRQHIIPYPENSCKSSVTKMMDCDYFIIMILYVFNLIL